MQDGARWRRERWVVPDGAGLCQVALGGIRRCQMSRGGTGGAEWCGLVLGGARWHWVVRGGAGLPDDAGWHWVAQDGSGWCRSCMVSFLLQLNIVISWAYRR